MFFVNEMKKIIIKKNIQNLGIFVDMDGVIADYRFGEGNNILNNVSGVYREKRPISATINVLKNLNDEIKCKMHILSSCYHSEQIEEKNEWLNKYASFFKFENRIIVKSSTFEDRKRLKVDSMIKTMKKFNYDYVVLIDDTHDILFLAIEILHEKVIPFHVITLLD